MGTTPRNSFSKIRHDAKMLVPTLGGVSLQNSMIWYGTQGDHTNHGGYKSILSMSRHDTSLSKSTQGATHILRKSSLMHIYYLIKSGTKTDLKIGCEIKILIHHRPGLTSEAYKTKAGNTYINLLAKLQLQWSSSESASSSDKEA